MNAIFDK